MNLTWTTRNEHFFKIRSNITSSFLRNARNKHGEFSYFKSFCLNWMTKHVVLRSSCFRLPAKSKEHIEEMSPFLKTTGRIHWQICTKGGSNNWAGFPPSLYSIFVLCTRVQRFQIAWSWAHYNLSTWNQVHLIFLKHTLQLQRWFCRGENHNK